VGDADIKTSPSAETVITLGGDGCGCWGGSIVAVGME
jgi:hypothetical protein